MNIRDKTVALIDELKATCQSAGLGNDGKIGRASCRERV